MQQLSGKNLEIVSGKSTYDSLASEFMYARGPEAKQALSKASIHPSSVTEALTLHEKRKWLEVKEFGEGVIDRLSGWKTAPLEEILHAVDEEYREAETPNGVAKKVVMIEQLSGMIDRQDSQSIQLAIVRKRGDRSEEQFTYLVVYPPTPGTNTRRREISYPTALCHTIDARALIMDSKPVSVGEAVYEVSWNKIPPISDDELKRLVEATGRTPLDALIQGGLKIFDQYRGVTGQHIDAVAALTNREYAAKYALATHRGLGLVDNEKIHLPPIT